jgi:hypothetical protein
MPTFARIGPYRFFVFSNEGREPPHVHIQRDEDMAKVWLSPVALARNDGFRSTELVRILRIVAERRDEFMTKWEAFHGRN